MMCELGGLASCFDEQRANHGALAREVVTMLNRSSWEIAAVLDRDNQLVAVVGDVSYVASWLGVRSSPCNPPSNSKRRSNCWPCG